MLILELRLQPRLVNHFLDFVGCVDGAGLGEYAATRNIDMARANGSDQSGHE
jgi:hypothetical protein